MSHDDLDIGATKKENKELTQEYEEADEYSYHDDESVNSNNNRPQEQKETVPTKPAPQNQESDIEEDYEF